MKDALYVEKMLKQKRETQRNAGGLKIHSEHVLEAVRWKNIENWDIKVKENTARDKEMKDGTERWRERQPYGGIGM